MQLASADKQNIPGLESVSLSLDAVRDGSGYENNDLVEIMIMELEFQVALVPEVKLPEVLVEVTPFYSYLSVCSIHRNPPPQKYSNKALYAIYSALYPVNNV